MTNSAELAPRPPHAAPWRAPVSESDELTKARWEMLNLVQWLARVANSFVPAGTPQERITLAFHADRAAFVTRTFGGGLSLEMRLPTLEMQFRAGDTPTPHVFDPEEHSPAEVEAWLLVELLHRGLDCAKFSKTLPYDTSHLMTGDAEDHAPGSCRQGLSTLTGWFRDAAAVLAAAMPAVGAGDARIVCWPQTLALAPSSNAGAAPADFGFSPGSARNPQPFFYANSRVPMGSGDAGSILAASKLMAENDPVAAMIAFVKAAGGRPAG